jgi:hypothetical protein
MRNTLVLSGERVSPDLRRTMSHFSGQLESFTNVVWIDDLVADLTTVTDAEFRARSERLRSRLRAPRAAEIWTANPRSPVDRFLLGCYPRADVVLFEDGLATYIAPWTESQSFLERARATGGVYRSRLRRDPHARSRLLQRGARLLGQRARRPSLVYLILAGTLGVPRPYRRVGRSISAETLRTVVGRLYPQTPPQRVTERRRAALVLGNSYSFWGAMSRHDEASLYARIIRRLFSAGFDIRWKEHPRTVQPFLAELRQLSAVDVQPYAADHAVPIEVGLRYNPVDLIVSGTSTSMFYVPLIFGDRIRVASFARSVKPLVRGVRSEIVELVASHVPDIDAVLQTTSEDGVHTTENHE